MPKFTVKKIAIVSSFFPPSDESAADYSYYLAKELKILGIDVKIITSWNNKACGAKTIDGFSLACIPSKRLMKRFFHISPKYYKNVKTEIEEFAPDCVVVNDYVRRLSFFGAKAAREADIACIAVNHLTNKLSHKVRFADTLLKKYEQWMLRRFKKRRAVFAGSGKPQIEHLKSMGAVPRYEIPYGIESDVIPLPAAKKRMGVNTQDILYVMESGDDADTRKAIKALDEIRTFNGPKIRLAVIGTKPAGEWDESVIFTGDISAEDVISIKADCDVYIHFVKPDSIGRGLMEAALMARAAVCVLPEPDYPFELAHDLQSALVVDDDMDKIKAALQKLRLHTKLRGELGAKLKTEVELKHAWSQSALALVDAVWELCGGRRRG